MRILRIESKYLPETQFLKPRMRARFQHCEVIIPSVEDSAYHNEVFAAARALLQKLQLNVELFDYEIVNPSNLFYSYYLIDDFTYAKLQASPTSG